MEVAATVGHLQCELLDVECFVPEVGFDYGSHLLQEPLVHRFNRHGGRGAC
jgi:hypothetical protein